MHFLALQIHKPDLDVDWAWTGATPKTVVSRAQGGLVDTRANGLVLWVRELR